jgi:hypothetical protein
MQVNMATEVQEVFIRHNKKQGQVLNNLSS